jgi:hypothetical protein
MLDGKISDQIKSWRVLKIICNYSSLSFLRMQESHDKQHIIALFEEMPASAGMTLKNLYLE